LRRIGLLLLAVLWACACLAIPARPALADHPAGGSLLPDLRTKEPERFSLVTSSGQRRLRFDNEVGNAHTGPLELVGSGGSDCDGDGQIAPAERPAFQRIYDDSDADNIFRRGTDSAYSEVQTGCIAYHPAHDHLHFQDFANYALAKLSDGAVVASSYKVTFCIMDSNRFFSALPLSPGGAYYADCNGPMQGISVGWSDEYPYSLADQYLVLNPNGQYIGDGEYCLISVADPGSRIREGNNAGTAESNNWASVRVKLSSGGTSVTRYSGTTCAGVGPEPWNRTSVSGDTQPPSAPQGLGAAAVSSTRVDLTWTASSDDVAVTGYRIYRDGAMVGSVGALTSYPDTTVRAGTTYDYEVRAVDAAGNESGPSETGSATTPVTVRFAPAADARVEQSTPATNHGTSTTLRTDGGSDPDVETYLRFDVTGVTGPLRSARLRLRTVTDTADGPAVFSTDWTGLETALTWNNRPGRTSGPAEDKGRIGSSTWVEYDVTSLVAGDGVYGFVLATGSSDGIDFRSREYSDATRRPELLLTF
jgi:chitodextrinase